MTVAEWVAAYGRAWEEKDPELAASIFTDDAVYRSQPFEEPYRGPQGVHEYWSAVTATQVDPKVRWGVPVVSADERKAAVEFWVTMVNDGAEVTLTGILLLNFAPDGRATELREAWHFETGLREPPAGWGE